MKLNEFLVKAKINTYASGREAQRRISANDGKELVYEENGFKYKDTYFGFNPFAGEEIVWKDKKCIWVMNYYGKVISNEVPVEEVYSFLRKAMKSVDKDRPFRGPKEIQEDDFKYVDENEGTINTFKGTERIFYKEKEIYILQYHGGTVKRK